VALCPGTPPFAATACITPQRAQRLSLSRAAGCGRSNSWRGGLRSSVEPVELQGTSAKLALLPDSPQADFKTVLDQRPSCAQQHNDV
jgi:hypothetical protein